MQATQEFRRFQGNFWLYGKVTLTASRATDFRFASSVQWPCADGEFFEENVRLGVESAIREDSRGVPPIQVTLSQIEWRETESRPLAYLAAAGLAMKDILREFYDT